LKKNTTVYLDNNATTRVLPEVRDAMVECLEQCYGNPSSAHAFGRLAFHRVEKARDHIANLIGCSDPEKIIFTSGGTESNNTVVLGLCHGLDSSRKLVISAVEHSSIIRTCKYLEECGRNVIWLPVDTNGLVDLEALENALKANAGFVSIQWVNNETGVIQDLEWIGALCQDYGVLFHSDSAQALGRQEIESDSLPVDFLTFSAHKIHGPKGVGAIYAKNPNILKPLLYGGEQEKGHRPGTENVPGIVGFGEAARIRSSRQGRVTEKLRFLRDSFEQGLSWRSEDIRFNGANVTRVNNTSNVTFCGIEGMALVAQLEAAGIYCSQSSACTNNRPEPSYVLRAMGLSESDAFSSIRFCFSEENREEDVVFTLKVLDRILRRLAY